MLLNTRRFQGSLNLPADLTTPRPAVPTVRFPGAQPGLESKVPTQSLCTARRSGGEIFANRPSLWVEPPPDRKTWVPHSSLALPLEILAVPAPAVLLPAKTVLGIHMPLWTSRPSRVLGARKIIVMLVLEAFPIAQFFPSTLVDSDPDALLISKRNQTPRRADHALTLFAEWALYRQ